MLKFVNIIREVKPKVILLEEPDFNTLGWYALFVTLMERAIHEAARSWFTPEGIIGEAHSAEAIYYWWTKNPNIIVEVFKELVESIRETAKKVVDPFALGPKACPEKIYLKRILF
ncbi:hypothetical protein KEJ34_07545 [Candidatus Bathyarchaeota archaeon]|nr:hypothetical protein [Candidatus Bathyarchaeota archaeon]